MERVLMALISFTLFMLFSGMILVLPLSATVYQWVDENGKTLYSNREPPAMAKTALIERKKDSRKNPDNPHVKEYYKFSDTLVQLRKINENGVYSTTLTSEMYAALKSLTASTGGGVKNLHEENLEKITQISDIREKMRSLKILEEKATAQNNHEKSLAITSVLAYCNGIMVKMVAEEFFDQNKIPYTPINAADKVCLDTEEPTSVAPSNQKTTSSTNQHSGMRPEIIIQSNCKNEWKDDYQMIEYCIKKQTAALKVVSGMRGPILEKCRSEWLNDYQMIEYCTNKQTAAKARLGY